MKLPLLKFYPSDWLSDEALRGCTPAARGLWVDMICLMAKSKRHGYLLAGDKPMTAEHLARIFGQSLETTSELLVELAQAGVYSMDNDTIFSRRMSKEEHRRKSDRDRQFRKRHGSVTQMSNGCHASVTGQRLEARSTQRLDIKRDRAQVRPTLEEWSDYAKSIGWSGKDVQGAFDHYEANGWKVGGRAPVKNWQAAARNCFRRNQNTQPKGTTQMQPKPQIKSSCESAPLYRIMGFASFSEWQKAGSPS